MSHDPKMQDELESLRASLHAIHTQVGLAIRQVGAALERVRAEPEARPRPKVFGGKKPTDQGA